MNETERSVSLSKARAHGFVFAALREWRLGWASADGVPAFVVFHTLAEIAGRSRRTLAELARISDVRPPKLDRYGAEVLASLADSSR